jgi:predicted metal-binding membrane protein
MWVVMMVAMMLPSLTPLLWGYREDLARSGSTHVGRLTAVVGLGYFAVWAAFGVIVFPLGVAMAAIVMREPELSRAVPVVVGAVALIAGGLQGTEWKARHLTFCREVFSCCLTPAVGAGTAWRYGVRLGMHCSHSCAGLTAVVLALGVMDLRVMAVVAAAITAEHLAPAGVRAARAVGAAGAGAGVFLIARAAGLG